MRIQHGLFWSGLKHPPSVSGSQGGKGRHSVMSERNPKVVALKHALAAARLSATTLESLSLSSAFVAFVQFYEKQSDK